MGSAWSSGGGTTVVRTITQTAHGFVANNVVRLSGSIFVLAQADNAVDAEVTGIVSQVIDANNFVLTTHGYATGLSGLTAGAVYFLSPTTAGALTTTEPSTPGQVSKPVLLADTTVTGYFFNFRGMVITPPTSLTGLLPPQAGNAYKLLGTDGTNASWQSFSSLGSNVDLALTDVVPVYHAGSDANINADRLLGFGAKVCEYRLTTASGNPIADTGPTTTLYWTPYGGGNRVTVYDGITPGSGRWRLYTPGELSLALGSLGLNWPVDVFVVDTGSGLGLSLSTWANVNSRSSSSGSYLAMQDGVYVFATDCRYRYVGTIACSVTAGNLYDTPNRRCVWNMYNRSRRPVYVHDEGANYTYSGGWRQVRANPANQFEVVGGLGVSVADLEVGCEYAPAAGYSMIQSICKNATNGSNANFFSNTQQSIGNGTTWATAKMVDYPNGWNFYAWTEYSPSTTVTVYTAGGGGALCGTWEC